MSEIAEAVKNPVVSALLALVIGGGGIGFVSESGEAEESEAMTIEFREADIEQNRQHEALNEENKDLLEKLTAIDKQVALLEKELEFLYRLSGIEREE